MLRIPITIILSLFFLSCSSQDKGGESSNFVFNAGDFNAYSGVAAPSAEKYLKIEQAKMIRNFSGLTDPLYKNIPPSIDLSQSFPDVGLQGNQNSCTGWVVSYVVKSFQENRELGWGFSRHLFSPSFIYNQINEGVDEGADLISALDFLTQSGTVPLNLMPYDEHNFLKKPSAEIAAVGQGFRALGYRRVDQTQIVQIKSYLSSGEPVALTLEVYENFLKSVGNIYDQKIGKLLGHHSLVAVGFDDEKQAIKIINSWGKGWGEGGYGWISYNLFPQVVKQAFIVYDTPTAPYFIEIANKGLGGEHLLIADNPKNEIPSSDFKSGYSSTPLNSSHAVLLVPDEAGVIYKDRWLRLGSPIKSADTFLKRVGNTNVKLTPDILGTNNISKIEFTKSASAPIYTKEGVTFGMSRSEVNRIYRKPDFAEKEGDFYFYHSATEDWGGIPMTKTMALHFVYNTFGNVEEIILESIFKEARTGQGFSEFSINEKKSVIDGTQIIAPDGKIKFIFPKIFTHLKKSDWGKDGYAYFAQNPLNPHDFMAVKILQSAVPIDSKILKKRIEADLAPVGLSNKHPTNQKRAGHTWQVVSDAVGLRYYMAIGSTFYQIQISSDQEEWSKQFWDSLFFFGFVVLGDEFFDVFNMLDNKLSFL